MGTYTDAAFGHSLDLEGVFAVGKTLIDCEGFHPYADGGYPEFTRELLKSSWNHPKPFLRSVVLESDLFLLWLYPRGGALHHHEVKWWVFAENGVMTSGLGREDVRSRSRTILRRFGSDRILYIPDSIGISELWQGAGIEQEEAYLREHCGPPLPWDVPLSPERYDSGWFRDDLPA